jgi:hypothetical protein
VVPTPAAKSFLFFHVARKIGCIGYALAQLIGYSKGFVADDTVRLQVLLSQEGDGGLQGFFIEHLPDLTLIKVLPAKKNGHCMTNGLLPVILRSIKTILIWWMLIKYYKL